MVKHIAVGPGAMAFFMFVGVFAKLKQTGSLADLEEISGASSGSILGFMYCLTKGDIAQILDFSLNVPIGRIMKPNIKNFLTNYGLVPTIKMKRMLSETALQFYHKDDITFKELYELHPIKLHISSYCVDAMKTVYFSVDSHPEMSVLDAVCASAAIPFLMSSMKMDGLNYIDGGAAETIPGAPFLGKSDIMTIKISGDRPIQVKDLKTYAMSILYSTMNLRHTYDFPSIVLPSFDDVYNFELSNENKIKLFMKGLSH